jgi:hypothetical protein
VRAPDSRLGRFGLFFASEAVSFFFIAANFRAVAQGLYFWTGVTDMLLVFQGMLVTRLMFDDERSRDWISIAGFSFGGATGSMLSIYVTRHLWGG